ncbi:MAG: helix-turn-helix domain-containing protein [Microcystaceae cyanobacterium]
MQSDKILQIQTSQTDEFAYFISQNLTPIKRLEPVEQEWQADFRAYPFHQLFVTYMNLPFGLSILPDPTDKFIFLEIPLKNKVNYWDDSKKLTHTCPPNSCFVVDQPTKVLFDKNALHSTLLIPKSLINTYARKMTNDELEQDFQIQSGSLLITEEGRAFRRYLSFIISELVHEGQLFTSASTILEVQSTILSLLITTAQNNDSSLDHQAAISCHPKYLNRAIDYIDAHLTEPLSLADLAIAAGVHSRTLSNGFKKYYDISPIAYVKQKRLEKTHKLLLEANPKETNVTDIATRYNFLHLGRFAQDYFNLFHELPSKTLRTMEF